MKSQSGVKCLGVCRFQHNCGAMVAPGRFDEMLGQSRADALSPESFSYSHACDTEDTAIWGVGGERVFIQSWLPNFPPFFGATVADNAFFCFGNYEAGRKNMLAGMNDLGRFGCAIRRKGFCVQLDDLGKIGWCGNADVIWLRHEFMCSGVSRQLLTHSTLSLKKPRRLEVFRRSEGKNEEKYFVHSSSSCLRGIL